MDLHTIARTLGGEVAGQQVLAPGRGHSAKDRSMWVRPSSSAPDGLLVGSFCGDPWQDCKDYVRQRLGLSRDVPARPRSVERAPRAVEADPDDAERTRRAIGIWAQARDPHGTIVEVYFHSRGLDLPDGAAAWLRFAPACPWREGAETLRVPAAVLLFRDVRTDEPRAIHRIRLTPNGEKVARMMLGPVGGAAIKIDEDVTMGLTIGEGSETSVAARQLGLRPVWALGSAGAIGAFPVLSGVEALTILEELDDSGANAKAIETCASRWQAAGREVLIVSPCQGGDVSDAIKFGRAV